jgi:hypothetical protein
VEPRYACAVCVCSYLQTRSLFLLYSVSFDNGHTSADLGEASFRRSFLCLDSPISMSLLALVRTSETPISGGLFCALIVLFLGLCGHLFLGLL